MVVTVKNYSTSITKAYRLGEIDSRMPFLTDIVPAKNDEAWTPGQVVIFVYASNYYKVGAAADVVTRVGVVVDAKETTATRGNILICGIICVQTTTILIEGDTCKLAATGQVAKWVSGTDAANLQAAIIFMKQARLISEGLGKAVTNSTTTDPGNKVLVWVNSPFA